MHTAVLAATDRRAGITSHAELGRVASYYCIAFVAITKATACIAPMTDETDILRLFANAGVHGVSVRERSGRM